MSIFQMFARDRRCGWMVVLFACGMLGACTVAPEQSAPPAPPQDTRAVTVVAFGDMPYRPVDFAAYGALLDAISERRSGEFTAIVCRAASSGSSVCSTGSP